MLAIELNFVMGLMFGIVHISGDEDDDFNFCVSVGLGPVQVIFYNFKTE